MIPEGIKVIGFEAEEKFIKLISAYGVEDDIAGTLFKTEIANLDLYGYGIKAFMLSLVECSINITGGTVRSDTIREIIGIGKGMLQRPIELLDDVKLVLERLAPHYRLIVATKGDLLDQEGKMRRSSISSFFHHIEVMSDKKEQHYIQLLHHLDIESREFLMIGNSIKSDIIPPLNLGAYAIHVPYHTIWAHEEVDEDPDSKQFIRVERLHEVLDLIRIPGINH
ncbi:MAG: HAD hydrolase-like protein [Bacteroidales bacterium]|nr:HAD hydrolase-like protein [Bacteroidales bacterium]